MTEGHLARLRDFCDAYLTWVKIGAPELNPFSRFAGLCENWRVFAQNRTFPANYLANVIFSYERCPFNNGSLFDYWTESDSGLCHTNSLRLEWVRKHSSKEEIL